MEQQIGVILVALATAALGARLFGPRELTGMAAAFAVTAAALTPNGVAPLALLGTAVALLAILALARPAWRMRAAAGTGAVAAYWAAGLHALGLPIVPAWLLGAALLAGVLGVARAHPGLGGTRLREEALLIVAGLAVLAAAGPTVVAGWESAAAFKAEPVDAGGAAAAGGPWLVAFVAACMAAGAGYTVWRRR